MHIFTPIFTPKIEITSKSFTVFYIPMIYYYTIYYLDIALYTCFDGVKTIETVYNKSVIYRN